MKKAEHSFIASLKSRSFRAGGYSVAAAVLVLSIAVAANLFINALPTSYTKLDNTSAQLFTVSQQTERLLAGLEDDIDIYWIVQSGQEDAALETLLQRYSSMSSRIKLIKKDPDVYPAFAQQYTSGTIYNNSLVIQCGERYRYVDISSIYEYDYSSYNSYGYDVSFNGESAVTSAIDYVTREDMPKLYTLTGHGETELSGNFTAAVENGNFELEKLSLLTVEAVPEDADALLICAPQSDLSQEETKLIQAYLQAGGHMILISDPPQGEALENLESLMASYGVSAAEGIVIEGDQSRYAYGSPHYLLPNISSHDITSPLASGGYYVLLPIAQGLTVSEELPEGVSVSKLLTTSNSAFSKPAGYSMTSYEKEKGDIDGPFSLAVAITASTGETEAKIVWVSSAALIDDASNARVAGGNQDMFVNCISWMCGQEESISIRAKTLSSDYLTIPSSSASMLSFVIIAILPLGVLSAGIYVWIRRKRR